MYCLLYLLFCVVSVFLKCLSEKGTVTRSDLAMWDNSLIKVSASCHVCVCVCASVNLHVCTGLSQVSKKTTMTKDMIEDIKMGLELCSMLKLPPDHQFTIHHLGCLLADDKFIRPLSHVR